jgi:cathepsin B
MSKTEQTLSEDKIKEKKELRKEEQKRLKEEKRKEYEEVSKKRKEKSRAAEEAALKLGKKRKDWFFNPYYLTFGGLFLVLIYIIVMLFMNRQTPLNKIPVLDEIKFFEHNSGNNWKQGACKFWEGQTLADAKRLMSTSFASHSNLNKCFVEGSDEIPESYDTREAHKDCKLPIMDQNKKCAGSYATASASTLAEKLCIESDENKLIPLSAQELLSCDTANKGCRGGYVNNALEYIVMRGLSTEECLPYKGTFDAKCSDMCADPMKVRPESFCVLFGDTDIKREIMKNGPVVSSMEIYTDFLSYKTGIYTKGEDVPKFSGYHTIKIVGWGVEDGSEEEPNKGNKYWIIENSWGEDWGQNGYAKVAEGQNLFFEQYAYSILTRKQTEEMKQSIERKNKAAAEAQKANEVPDMNLDDDDVNNKNP